MNTMLCVELHCKEDDKIVVRRFVKDIEIDGAVSVTDEIQLVPALDYYSQLEKSYVLKIKNAKIRRLIVGYGAESWLFLLWENIDFAHGDTDKLFGSGWSETNYHWEHYLSGKVSCNKRKIGPGTRT